MVVTTSTTVYETQFVQPVFLFHATRVVPHCARRDGTHRPSREPNAMSNKEDLEDEVQRLLAMNTKTVETKTETVKSPAKTPKKEKAAKGGAKGGGKKGAGDEKTPLLNADGAGASKGSWGMSCGNPFSGCFSACSGCVGSCQAVLGVYGSWIAGVVLVVLAVYLCLTFLVVPAGGGSNKVKLAFEKDPATQWAAMASAAYRPVDKLTSWTCGPCETAEIKPKDIITQTIPEADGLFYTSVVKTDSHPNGVLVLTLRGTMLESAATWTSDLDFFYTKTKGIGENTDDKFGNKQSVSWLPTELDVHPGFFKLYELYQKKIIRNMADQSYILKNQKFPVIVVGHSLGGALATFAAYDLTASGFNVQEVWTFGSPRVGSESFASAYANVLGHRTWRVVNNNDKIPHVPHYPMYHHVPAELWCKSDNGSCNKYEHGDGTGEDWSLSGHYHFAGFPIKSLVDHNRAMGIPFDGAPLFKEDALQTTFKSGLFTADFDVIGGPFPDPCAIRPDADVCAAELEDFIETKQRAVEWATSNEQNALQKLMKRKHGNPPPPPPSPPPGQVAFEGVDTGFMPQAEEYGEALYGK